MPALNMARLWAMQIAESIDDPRITYEVDRLLDIHNPTKASSDHSMSAEQHAMFEDVVHAMQALKHATSTFLTKVTPEMAKAASQGRKDGEEHPTPYGAAGARELAPVAPRVRVPEPDLVSVRVGGIDVVRPREKT